MKIKKGDYISLACLSIEEFQAATKRFEDAGFNLDNLVIWNDSMFLGVDDECDIVALKNFEPYGTERREVTYDQLIDDSGWKESTTYTVKSFDGFKKQDKYKDQSGETDFLDRTMTTMSPERFRGAMVWTIGKYLDRLGEKDDIVKEVYKIADYAQRWLDYEQKRSGDK